MDRLQRLQQSNASIRADEVEYLERQLEACNEVIANAHYELQAIKLVVAT